MRVLILLMIGLTTVTPALAVEEPNDAVLRAVAAIQLTEEQQGPFGEVMQEFFGDVRNAVRRELQRNTGRDKRKAIQKRIAMLFEKLDEPVGEILTQDQWIPYLMYKQAVADHIRENGVVARR